MSRTVRTNTRLLPELPGFGTKNALPFDPVNWRLKVDGVIKRQLTLSFEEVLKLPRTRLSQDFTCTEGWQVKDIEWEGIRVRTILELAGPRQSAHFTVFKAREFTATLELEKAIADGTILAYRYKGKMLTLEHGAPLRLIFSAQNCFESVKCVNQIEILEKHLPGTGKEIALKRILEKTKAQDRIE